MTEYSIPYTNKRQEYKTCDDYAMRYSYNINMSLKLYKQSKQRSY